MIYVVDRFGFIEVDKIGMIAVCESSYMRITCHDMIDVDISSMFVCWSMI